MRDNYFLVTTLMGRKATMQSLRLLLVQASQRGYSPFSNTYCSPLQPGCSYPTHLEQKENFFVMISRSVILKFPSANSTALGHFTLCITPLVCVCSVSEKTLWAIMSCFMMSWTGLPDMCNKTSSLANQNGSNDSLN